MTMFLVPGGLGRERLLAYGSEGSGKTFGAFSVMDKVPGRFFYLDTDQTVIPFLDGERFAHLQDRLTFEEPDGFGAAVEFVEKCQQEGAAEDWLFIDRSDWLWDEAQAEFSDRVFGVDIDEHLMQYRQTWQAQANEAKKAGNPFDGFTDWTVIKKRHQRIIKAVLKFPGHVYMTAAEKKLIQGMEDQNTTRSYGAMGFKPAGEKNNGHAMRSVLRFQGNNPATWRITTAKDRERQQLDGVGVSNFALDYLVKVAKWKVVTTG